jgi:hypothetical protein
MTAAQLARRIFDLETELRAERERSATLARVCDAWSRAFGTRAQPPIAGGAERKTPAPAVGSRSYGTDDGEYMSFAEWADRKAGRDREDDWS